MSAGPRRRRRRSCNSRRCGAGFRDGLGRASQPSPSVAARRPPGTLPEDCRVVAGWAGVRGMTTPASRPWDPAEGGGGGEVARPARGAGAEGGAAAKATLRRQEAPLTPLRVCRSGLGTGLLPPCTNGRFQSAAALSLSDSIVFQLVPRISKEFPGSFRRLRLVALSSGSKEFQGSST